MSLSGTIKVMVLLVPRQMFLWLPFTF